MILNEEWQNMRGILFLFAEEQIHKRQPVSGQRVEFGNITKNYLQSIKLVHQ